MLLKIINSKTKGRILKKLIEQKREMWFEEIAKSTGISFGAVHPALKDLAESRILTVRKVGRTKLYSLNKSHFLFPEIKRLFESETKKPMEAAKEFARKISKKNIVNVILFGSLARGEFGEKSDIDILIIYKGSGGKIKESIYQEAETILKKYDFIVSVTYVKEADAKKRLARLDRFFIKAVEEGKILHGDEKWLKK